MAPQATQDDSLLNTKDRRSLKRELQNELSGIQGRRVSDFKNFTQINNGTIQINDTVYQSLDIHVLPYDLEDTCADSLTFFWECTEYDSNLMLIQLDFDKPECVSAGTNLGDTL